MTFSANSTNLSTSTNFNEIWTWQGFPVCYQSQGNQGPAVLLVHGFGASLGHWRKNIPVLATETRVYAIDLIGFGASAKPLPGKISYTFETWGKQIVDFCREVIGGPAFLVGNSIGCIAVMQAAVMEPDIALGLIIINCSLRMLHDRRRQELSLIKQIGTPIVQQLLAVKRIGNLFFQQLARPATVRKILLLAYKRSEAVTDELVDIIMEPALDPGAVYVFLAFTNYSQGPLPEDLLPILPCSALILWGEEDPWEPIELGCKLAEFPTVEKFINLPGVGHCPQDEAPEIVNPILLDWIAKKSAITD